MPSAPHATRLPTWIFFKAIANASCLQKATLLCSVLLKVTCHSSRPLMFLTLGPAHPPQSPIPSPPNPLRVCSTRRWSWPWPPQAHCLPGLPASKESLPPFPAQHFLRGSQRRFAQTSSHGVLSMSSYNLPPAGMSPTQIGVNKDEKNKSPLP